jgi:hypothetical protein
MMLAGFLAISTSPDLIKRILFRAGFKRLGLAD